MSRARDVVEVVARALADRPEAVQVTERESRGQTLVDRMPPPAAAGTDADVAADTRSANTDASAS